MCMLVRTARSGFTRVDDRVTVEVVDPLARHKALWSEIDDATMHDVTAFLETLR